MSISFDTIPVDLRAPLFYAEISSRRASAYAQNLRSIIFAYAWGKSGVDGDLRPIGAADEARDRYGWGSMASRMVAAFRRQNPFGELWVYPLAEPSGGTQASGTVTFSGTASEAGHVYLYLAGQRIQVPIPAGTTAVNAATLVRQFITRQKSSSDVFRDLPINASNTVDETATAVLTITAKNKGTHGNLIDIRLNYNVQGGERLPRGLGATVGAMSGGTGSVDLSTALAALNDEPFEYFITPFNGSGDVTTITDFLESRYGPTKQLYGNAWMAKEGTYSGLYSFGDSINERSLSVLGYIASPTWEPEVAAMYGGVASREYSIDPARPLQSLELVGMLPPPVTRRWTLDQLNALLYQGISPAVEEGGAVRIKRSITTHQVNADNGLDTSYLDSTRMPSLAKYIRMRRQLIASRYGRHKVAPDGTKFGAGQVVVTPSMMRGDLIVQYKEMERAGLVQDTDAFIESLVVELNENDPSRMDILDTPIFVSPLAVAAVKVEFRL